jgi:glycosyltransferase involved in cell wall biosynthesis
MVRALLAEGHHVELLTYPQGQPPETPGLVHFRSLRLSAGRVRPGPSVAKLLLDIPFMAEAWLRMVIGRYDVVHAVEEAAHLAAPVARLLRLPLVMDVDSSIPDQLRESGFARRGPLLWTAEALERRALRSAAVVVTVCDSLSEGVRRHAPDARVFQVEDPPLVERAAPSSSPLVATLRGELGLDGRPVVLYSGNFEAYQGVDLLRSAAALVPEAQFVFMGGEPAQVEAARKLSPANCVFAGKRPPIELPSFLGLADVLVSPRVSGVNTPFKIYTYLASGKPLVATRLPTHTQLLDDTRAFLADPTPDALAAAIRAALGDPEEAGRRAAAAVALIQRDYSATRYAEKVRNAYAAVTRRKASS